MSRQKPCPQCGGSMYCQSKLCKDCSKSNSKISKSCPACNRIFSVYKSELKHGQGKYCSVSCARSGSPTRKKESPTVECAQCKSQFTKFKSEIIKNKKGLNFCSTECWYQYNQKENAYNWTGGQDGRSTSESRKWRKSVLARDNNRCRLCHCEDKLEAHHIHPFGKFPDKRWDINNGVTLCKKCHIKFARKELDFVEILSMIAITPMVLLYV